MGNRPRRIRLTAAAAAAVIAASSLGATDAAAQFDVNRIFDFGTKLYRDQVEQQRRAEEERRREEERRARERAMPPPPVQQQTQIPPPPRTAWPQPAGPTRAEVRETQDRLNRLGYDAGPADGLMGPRTASAIADFQRDSGMVPTGGVDDSLLARLRGAPAPTYAGQPEEGGAAWRPPASSSTVSSGGAGLIPVGAVHQDGHLLTGYPLLHGRHHDGDTDMLGPHRIRSHVELSRLFDLLILAARPNLLDDHQVARDYVVRFLPKAEQERFLAECRYGSCGGSKTPFAGWAGGNEFEREATHRRFVAEYRDRLLAMAPEQPPPLLHVVEMEVQPYDRGRQAFPLDVRGQGTILATVQPAYRLGITDEFARPTALPVPEAEAAGLLARLPERRAYLALKGTLAPFTDSRFGKGLDTSLLVQSAALYADPELRQELHSFGLFTEGGKAVAAAQASGEGGTGANGARAIAGPGGEAMLELALPQGLKPLRFMALHDLPVMGDPVLGRGALSPGTLKGLYGHAPEVETELDRVVNLLQVAAQPKLFEGLRFAEEFVDMHGDEATQAHFFPPSRANLIGFGKSFGEDEFARKDRHEQFKQRFAQASFPQPPFEVLYVEAARLGDYDSRTGRYPLKDFKGGGTGIEAAVSRFMPEGFPIPPEQARALISRVSHNQVFLAYHVALTGVKPGGRRASDATVALRGLAVYEDELLTKPLHTFKIESEGGDAPRQALPPMAHMAMHLASLYEVRDIKGWMSDTALLEGAARLVQTEQHAWRAASGDGGVSSGRCRGGKMTVFEWDRARQAAPALANGPLLDALIGVPVDWGFLNEQTRFGLVPDHCVAVHVFPRDRIEGREPEFAARDGLGFYRAAIEAAAARAPKTVYVAERLPAPRYDHASGELYFPPKYESQSDKGWSMRSLTHIGQVAPEAEAPAKPSSRTAYVPQDMEGRVFYRLGSIGDTQTIGDSGIKPTPLGQGDIGGMWRQTIWSVTDERPRRLIALDRVLDTPRLPMPAAQAEKIIAGRDDLSAIITLDIDRAQASPANGGSIIVARLRDVTVLGKDGAVVATVPASAFTTGEAIVSAAQEAERKKAAEAAAKEQAKQDMEARLAAVLGDHQGTVMVRRAGAGPITTVYNPAGSSGVGYQYTVRDNNLDLPAKATQLSTSDMGARLRSEDGAALVVNVQTFARSVFPDVADVDLDVTAWPPEPKALAPELAAEVEKHLPEGTKVVLVRRPDDTGDLETVYTTTSSTGSAHLNWHLKLQSAPEYATVEKTGERQEVALRDVPDLLRNGRNVGVLLEPDGLRTLYGRLADLKPTIVRFPMAEYSFGIEKDHTRTASDYDILGIAGGMAEAAALAAVAKEFTPEEVRHDEAKGEILATRGPCDGPLTAPPAKGQEGAYCLRVMLDDGKVSRVTLRQVVPGRVIDTADEAFRKRYDWTPFFKETRYYPASGKRVLIGFGARLTTDREALGRVDAATPPTALEAVAWAHDDVTAVLLQLDNAVTLQEAEARSKPKLKF